MISWNHSHDTLISPVLRNSQPHNLISSSSCFDGIAVSFGSGEQVRSFVSMKVHVCSFGLFGDC